VCGKSFVRRRRKIRFLNLNISDHRHHIAVMSYVNNSVPVLLIFSSFRVKNNRLLSLELHPQGLLKVGVFLEANFSPKNVLPPTKKLANIMCGQQMKFFLRRLLLC
jgi:hypothetical protein